jgi:hypothetical protein
LWLVHPVKLKCGHQLCSSCHMHAVENVLLLEVIELRAISRQPRLLQVVPYVRNLQGCWTITTYPRRTWTATVLCTPVDLILWVPVVFPCMLHLAILSGISEDIIRVFDRQADKAARSHLQQANVRRKLSSTILDPMNCGNSCMYARCTLAVCKSGTSL